MKRIKMLSLLAIALLAQWNLIAQDGPGRGPRGHERPPFPPMEHLQEALDLTDDQVTQIKGIHEDYKDDFDALRDKEFENRDDRRDAMKELMTQLQDEVKTVLTEEQITKLEELKANRPERGDRKGPKGKLSEEDRDALKGELEAYHETNVAPVMKAQREKLEAQLSAEDKATIDELRAERETHHEAMKEARENGERPERDPEAMKAQREQVKALVEKYDEDITALLEEVKPQAEQWKEDIKAIHEKYAPEKAEGGKKGMRQGKARGKKQGAEKGEGMKRGKEGKGMKGQRPGMKKAHFLLMDPDAESSNTFVPQSGANRQLQAAPNPASNLTNISYDVPTDGKVRIELRNDNGKVVKVLFDGYRQTGNYNMDINVSNLQPGVYYYSILSSDGAAVTKKLVVTE